MRKLALCGCDHQVRTRIQHLKPLLPAVLAEHHTARRKPINTKLLLRPNKAHLMSHCGSHGQLDTVCCFVCALDTAGISQEKSATMLTDTDQKQMLGLSPLSCPSSWYCMLCWADCMMCLLGRCGGGTPCARAARPCYWLQLVFSSQVLPCVCLVVGNDGIWVSISAVIG